MLAYTTARHHIEILARQDEHQKMDAQRIWTYLHASYASCLARDGHSDHLGIV